MDDKEKEAMASSDLPPSYESVLSGGSYPTPSAPSPDDIDTQQELMIDDTQIELDVEQQQNDRVVDDESRSRLKKEHLSTLLPFLLIYAAIPVTMLVIGIINLDKCPMDSHIPIFMITSGAITISVMIFPIVLNLFPISADGSKRIYCLQGVFLVFLLGMLAIQIWGSVIVFRKWSYWNSNDELLKNNIDIGCNTTTYLFAFSILIIYWILLPIFLYMFPMLPIGG